MLVDTEGFDCKIINALVLPPILPVPPVGPWVKTPAVLFLFGQRLAGASASTSTGLSGLGRLLGTLTLLLLS